MGIAEIIAGIKTTYSAATTAIETRDAVKLNEVKLTMSNQLLELYTAAFALLESDAAKSTRCRELEDELMDLRKKSDQASRYEAHQPHIGTIVLRLKADYAVTEPMHYLCPTCMENRKIKSILQFPHGKQIVGRCFECNATYRFSDTPPMRITTSW